MNVRVRIAPSPTGKDLHLGNLFTALINWAFAKKNNGRFIIRIEDTDQQRLVKGSEQKIIKTLKDYGLDYDEGPGKSGQYGPYRQSERLKTYRSYAAKLINKNQAYYCVCSQERLKQVREKRIKQKLVPKYDKYCLNHQNQVIKEIKAGKKFVIRLKAPQDREIVFNDLIRGNISFKSNDLEDQVLLKSDGYPTYHLAVVVDDFLMKISHVIRAEEWISSTPKHILLYEAFNWPKPIYCHLPLLRNPDRSKLSKRKNPVWASWYLKQGYLPEAMLNYLAVLSWAHPREKTIFSLAEFIKYFDLKDLSVAGPIFDIKKLDYINGAYIRKTNDKKLVQLISQYCQLKIENWQLEKIVPLIKERISTLAEVNDLIEFFVKDVKYDPKLLISKGGDKNLVKKQLSAINDQLSVIKDWNLKSITKSLQALCESNKWRKGQFFMSLRVAVTAKTITPPLMESMEILGKEKVLEKIEIALKKLS